MVRSAEKEIRQTAELLDQWKKTLAEDARQREQRRTELSEKKRKLLHFLEQGTESAEETAVAGKSGSRCTM